MDATISTATAAQSRRLSGYQQTLEQSGLVQVGIGRESAAVHAGLFEQILSMPLPLENTRPPSAEPAPPPEREPDAAAGSSERHDEPAAEGDDSLSDEESLAAANAAALEQQAALLAADQATRQALASQTETTTAGDVESPLDTNSQPQQVVETLAKQAGDAAGDQLAGDQSAVDTAAELAADAESTAETQVEPLSEENPNPVPQSERAVDQPIAAATDELTQQPEANQGDQPLDGNDADAESDAVVMDETDKQATAEDGNRRDRGDRRERWFERDPAEQPTAVEPTHEKRSPVHG